MTQYAYESAGASFSWADAHINCNMISTNADIQSAAKHLHTWHLSNETACVRDATKIELITVK